MATIISTKTSGVGGLEVTGDATGILQLASNNGTTAVTVDASQNVGIGTASPTAKLHVSGSSSNIVASFDKGTSNQAGVHLKNSAQTYTTYVDINNNGTNWWSLYDANNDDLIDVYVPTSYRAFYTVGTERMRIDANGNVLVGTTDASLTSGNGLKYLPGTIQFGQVISGTVNTFAIYNTTAGAYRFFVNQAGQINATSTSITAISDESLKENIRDLDTGLESVMALKPRRFDWKEETAIGEKNVAGFIAQEVENVLPELVYNYQYNADETKKALKMGDILPTLVKSIQELKAIIDTQAERIAVLENKIV